MSTDTIRAFVRIKPTKPEEADDISLEKHEDTRVLVKETKETFEFGSGCII